MGEWWQEQMVDTGKQPLLLCASRSCHLRHHPDRGAVDPRREGRPKDNVVGGVHVHHAVPGLILMVISGLAALGAQSIGWQSVAGVGFGIGLALVLDEFALILHLEDVYWSEQGRESVNAVLLVGAVIALVLIGATPVDASDPTLGIWAFAVFFVNLFFAALCIAKGKLFTGVLGLVVPTVGVFGAVRLARPGSVWARRWYAEGSRNRARASPGRRPTRSGTARAADHPGPHRRVRRRARPVRARLTPRRWRAPGLGIRVGGGQSGQQLVADRGPRLSGLAAGDPPPVAAGVQQRRLVEAAGAGGGDAAEEQFVVGHRRALEHVAGEPRHRVRHHRVAVDDRQVLRRHVAEAAPGIGEVLALGDLVGGQDRHREAPLAAMRGDVSCLGDTDAITIGSSKATWLTQCDV